MTSRHVEKDALRMWEPTRNASWSHRSTETPAKNRKRRILADILTLMCLITSTSTHIHGRHSVLGGRTTHTDITQLLSKLCRWLTVTAEALPPPQVMGSGAKCDDRLQFIFSRNVRYSWYSQTASYHVTTRLLYHICHVA